MHSKSGGKNGVKKAGASMGGAKSKNKRGELFSRILSAFDGVPIGTLVSLSKITKLGWGDPNLRSTAVSTAIARMNEEFAVEKAGFRLRAVKLEDAYMQIQYIERTGKRRQKEFRSRLHR